MAKVFVIGPKDPVHPKAINTTSHSNTFSKGLSPFYLGPVELYGGYVGQNVEASYQHTKCYPADVDENGDPSPEYWKWAKAGWERKHWPSKHELRYPRGKGVIPLYSYWDGKKLSYIEARKQIYIPIYSKAVRNTDAFCQLQFLYEIEDEIWLWDFDGYNHKELGMNYDEVISCEKRKMGHAFVLAMMLEGYLK